MSVVNEEKTDEKAELNARLYEKMQEELDEFRSKFCDADPMVVMENAYELTMKEDIVYSLEDNDVSIEEAKALLEREHPLHECYLKYENTASRHMEEIWDAITCRAHEIQREAWKKAHRSQDEAR